VWTLTGTQSPLRCRQGMCCCSTTSYHTGEGQRPLFESISLLVFQRGT
jgi:hypothetical protein